MIKYRLACAKDHEFEVWFKSSDACDAQIARGVVNCPTCGTAEVAKAPMAPSVAKRERTRASAPSEAGPAQPEAPRQRQIPAEVLQVLREMRRDVEQRTEYVGSRFSEEARRMHYKESAARPIHGEATLDEARQLAEEGIDFLPLPRLPEDSN